MKKFNLNKEIIYIEKSSFLNALNSNREFFITTDGKVTLEPKSEDILLFKGTAKVDGNSKLSATPSLNNVLGANYKLVEDGEKLLFKANSAWTEIIELNKKSALYDDTSPDGISEFEDKELEEIGWHACEFNINYRTIVEELELKCDITILCLENEEPYMFSGLGFSSDLVHIREVAFKFVKDKVESLVKNDEDYEKEELTNDQIEAAQFFKINLGE
ncbi:MAG: hypothetical protein GQ570_00575 [Helicobacteraceae bacterium]|nr:hypothetical protein [Helicobacteraceae bacterium]